MLALKFLLYYVVVVRVLLCILIRSSTALLRSTVMSVISARAAVCHLSCNFALAFSVFFWDLVLVLSTYSADYNAAGLTGTHTHTNTYKFGLVRQVLLSVSVLVYVSDRFSNSVKCGRWSDSDAELDLNGKHKNTSSWRQQKQCISATVTATATSAVTVTRLERRLC